MKKTYSLAFSALICAVSVVLMLLTGLIPVGTYAIPCAAGAVLAAVVIESGYVTAVSAYFVVSVLSVLIAADKEAVLYYIAFLGFYPIVKGVIEKLGSKIIQWVLKFLLFNLCIIGAFFVSIHLLSVPEESFNLFGVYVPWVFLLAGNLIFLVYDICLTRLITIYIRVWRNKLKFK